MKVLKPGKTKILSTETICSGAGNGEGGCEARLLVESSDLYITSRYYMDGSSESFITFQCPFCKVETDLENVPQKVKEKLVNEKKWQIKEKLVNKNKRRAKQRKTES